eukprot:m.69485 g.69485  ORF g.69485 m.69485 type:complete len:420 (+) comp12058_c0_seq3:143-1402(+)
MMLGRVFAVAFLFMSLLNASDGQNPLKVFILAGQSNMEGQAEVATTWPVGCQTVCCEKNNPPTPANCCPVNHGSCGQNLCPHDPVQGPGNSSCYKNGTLAYQLRDPRTKAEFAECWDATHNNWTVLERVKIWFNEGIGKYAHGYNGHPLTNMSHSLCPKGYCPVTNGNTTIPCSTKEPFGGCGVWGNLSVGFGVGGDLNRIGPEYGFSFAIDPVLHEDVLILKFAHGGTTLCGDWRPPSSCVDNKTVPDGKVGHLYTNMVESVNWLLAPENLTHYFPEFAGRTAFDIAGFGWFQGWNDGCTQGCVDEYETNMVNLIKDLRKAFNNSKMAVSIPVSGFDGWGQHIPRRLGIINAQFNAANASLHPELGGHVIAEETRSFWRNISTDPSNQVYHFGHNAETYFLIGKAMGTGMLKMMNSTL